MVSFPVQGAPPKGSKFAPKQRWQIPRDSPVVLRNIGLPASMRNPYRGVRYEWAGLMKEKVGQKEMIGPYRLEGRHIAHAVVRHDIINGHALILV